MRAPIYLAFCAAAWAAALPLDAGPDAVDAAVAADPDTINFLLPKMATEWRAGVDPRRFYVLAEMDSNELDNDQREKQARRMRNKRYNSYSPTLSVQAPIQALRNLYDRSNYQQRIFQNRRLINQLSSS